MKVSGINPIGNLYILDAEIPLEKTILTNKQLFPVENSTKNWEKLGGHYKRFQHQIQFFLQDYNSAFFRSKGSTFLFLANPLRFNFHRRINSRNRFVRNGTRLPSSLPPSNVEHSWHDSQLTLLSLSSADPRERPGQAREERKEEKKR